jgi:PAS domain S-box-containing protein
MAFGVSLLAPGLILAAVLLWNYTSSEKERLRQEAQDASQRIVAAVDRELTGILSAAQALATSNSLLEGNYEAFHRQAVATLRSWSDGHAGEFAIVVRDSTGQQVANTRLPWGAPLPKGANLPADLEVMQSRKPVIQDLFVGATAGRPIISIRVPVVRGDEVTHVLSMALDPKRFTEVLLAQKMSPTWIAAVIDRSGRLVARSHQSETFLGQSAPAEFLRTATAPEGIYEGTNLEEAAILGGYTRSSFSGWLAFVGIPSSLFQGALRQSLWTLAVLGASLLSLSFLLALWFGRQIARSVYALAADAQRVGQGHPVAASRTGPAELDVVSDALSIASTQLLAREAELRASEERLRATHENAAVGIVEVDREGRFIAVNEMRCRLTGHSRGELLGQHFGQATYGVDIAEDMRLFQRQVAGELNTYTVENRFRRKDGTSGWVRVSSTAVRDPGGTFLYAVRIVEDITERKQSEVRQKLLVDELNHRVKNTLATVQSLAMQSARPGVTPQVAQERFQERLLALSRTHNLLNQTSWEGTTVSGILQTELEPYATERDRVQLTGPSIELPASMAVVLGLAVHELATNACKYGSLSAPNGRLMVKWSREQGEGGTMLRLEWRESDGPSVRMPTQTGFGSRLIRRAVVSELGGHLDLAFDANGLRCEITVPLGEPLRSAA